MPDRRLRTPGGARREELQRTIGLLNRRLEKLQSSLEDTRGRVHQLEKAATGLTAGVGRIEQLLATGTSTKPGLVHAVQDLRAGVEGITRLLAISAEDLPYPERLTSHRFGLSSQRGEDGVIQAIFREAGVTDRRFVELGCGDNGGNSGFLAGELGWTGLMLDGSADNARIMRRRLGGRGVTVVDRWLTREDADGLLAENGIQGELDLLSIDIDGNDFWVWDALTSVSPRLVVIEFNTAFGPDRSVAVPYAADFARDKATVSGLYYGASLPALTRLARRKGYRLVVVENVNAFFLRDDVAPQIPAADPATVYRLYAKEGTRLDGLGGDLFDVLAQQGLELAEIGELGEASAASQASE